MMCTRPSLAEAMCILFSVYKKSVNLKLITDFYSKTNQMHNISNLFWNNILHVSDCLSVHHQGSKSVHTASGISHTGSVAAC